MSGWLSAFRVGMENETAPSGRLPAVALPPALGSNGQSQRAGPGRARGRRRRETAIGRDNGVLTELATQRAGRRFRRAMAALLREPGPDAFQRHSQAVGQVANGVVEARQHQQLDDRAFHKILAQFMPQGIVNVAVAM